MADSIIYTGDLPCYVWDCLHNNLMDKSKLAIRVFLIAFVMSLIEKFTELLNTLMIKYELE